MQRVPLPGWVLALSILLFIVTWLWAPAETLSGELHVPSTQLRKRLDGPALRARGKALPGSAQARQRPLRVLGFGHPYQVALTFDDGPHPYLTGRLLDILARHQVKGTFFVNGFWMDQMANKGRARSVLLRAHLEGHLIGNHTYGHELLARLKPDQQTWQIVANELLIDELLGERVRVFRPPYGQITPHSSKVLAHYGYQEVLWNITAREAETGDPEQVARELLTWLGHHRGGIVLLHDRHAVSVDATEIFLARLFTLNCKRLAHSKRPYRVVGLDYFLESPAESQALANRRATERRRYEQRLAARCQRH